EAIEMIDDCVRRASANGIGGFVIGTAFDTRLRYFQGLKDPAGCRTSAEMFERFKPASADDLYSAARYRAVTAAVFLASGASPDAGNSAVAEADRAMEWLVKAVNAGYRDMDHLEADNDLTALRGREDLKKLLADRQTRLPPIDRAWRLATDPNPTARDPAKAL